MRGFFRMKTVTVTTKTREQIAADFAAAFKDMQPAHAAERPTQKDRLAPYRKEILRLRRRGLSWNQIAAGMRNPPINERVTAKLLRLEFGTAPADATKATPKDPSPVAPAVPPTA